MVLNARFQSQLRQARQLATLYRCLYAVILARVETFSRGSEHLAPNLCCFVLSLILHITLTNLFVTRPKDFDRKL